MEEKDYFSEEEEQDKEVNEPAVEYGIYQKESTDGLLFDIPQEYLLQQIAKAEKDIEEGKLTTHEEMKKRFRQ